MKDREACYFWYYNYSHSSHIHSSISYLRNKWKDKAKVTVAMIQELSEDLQSIEQDSILEESESVITQESDVEQEDSEDYMTESEEQ